MREQLLVVLVIAGVILVLVTGCQDTEPVEMAAEVTGISTGNRGDGLSEDRESHLVILRKMTALLGENIK